MCHVIKRTQSVFDSVKSSRAYSSWQFAVAVWEHWGWKNTCDAQKLFRYCCLRSSPCKSDQQEAHKYTLHVQITCSMREPRRYYQIFCKPPRNQSLTADKRKVENFEATAAASLLSLFFFFMLKPRELRSFPPLSFVSQQHTKTCSLCEREISRSTPVFLLLILFSRSTPLCARHVTLVICFWYCARRRSVDFHHRRLSLPVRDDGGGVF